MRYVNFKSIKASNFLSIGRKPVEVNFRPGLNIITGKNYDKADRANGVGKSTVADAVHFALYGSTIRDIKKENILNDQSPNSTCEVELEFSYHQEDNIVHECKIIRTLNPTKCFLYIDGVDSTRSGVPQTTEEIINIIKTSPEVFQNSVVLTLNSTVPFMAQKKVEKRKFIEGILGLEVFSNMLLQARQDYNDVKKLLDVEDTKYQEVDRSLADSIKQRDAYEETKKKRIGTLVLRQTHNEQELAILNERLEKFEPVDNTSQQKIDTDIAALKTAINVITPQVDDVYKLVTEAQTYIRVNTDRLKKLKKVETTCPHCGKNIAEAANIQYEKDKTEYEKDIELYKAKEIEHSTKYKTLKTRLESINTAATALEKKKNDFVIRKKEVENATVRIGQLKVFQDQLKSDIEQLNKDSNTFQESIDAITKRLNEIKLGITSLQEQLDIIEHAKFITSEEGVKSFIVKKILEVLNKRLSLYLQRLEGNCKVWFNEFFEETITNELNTECSYFNFSGAERKAIDLAMLFTFQDIRRAQADVCLNLSMFDELFDSSLDEKGIELVLDILRERVDNYNEAIYIISHRKESKKYCTGGEVVFLEKKNRITTRNTNYDTIQQQ